MESRAVWEKYWHELICTREDVAWWPQSDSSVHQFLYFTAGRPINSSFPFVCPSLSVWTDIYNTELKCAMSELAFNSPILPSHPCPAVFPFLSRGDVSLCLLVSVNSLNLVSWPDWMDGCFSPSPHPSTPSAERHSVKDWQDRERERERLQSWQAPATLLAGLIVDRKSGSRVSHVTPMGWCLAQWSIVERGGDYTHSKPYSF